jgi:2'-5' RNA ligase
MTVQKISLMRSDFGKHGAVYTEIGSVEASK